MCVSRSSRAADPLRHILGRVYEPTTRQPVPWLLSGDAALALQGVDIDPQVIEFRAISPYAVAYFSGFMKPYEVPANAATVIYKRGGDVPPSDGWRSNVHQPIVAWSTDLQSGWIGRWNVEGCPAQVVYTRGVQLDPTALTSPQETRRVHFEGMEVAVVPIEFLLAETAMRNRTQETNRILHALRTSGYSVDTLHKALDILPSDKALRILRLLEIRLVAG